MSFVFYLASIIFIVAAFFIGLGNYSQEILLNGNSIIAAAYGLQGFLLLLPVVMVLYLIGRIIDTRSTRYLFRGFKYGMYIGSSIILWVLLYSFVAWILGQIYFSGFVDLALAAIVLGIGISFLASSLRGAVLKTKRLNGKLVVNELGALIGKVARIDLKRGRFIINTSFGNPVNYSIDRIVEISDKVVVK